MSTSDLAGIAQYHLNAAGRNRAKLAQVIKDAFLPTKDPPKSLEIAARLPFSHIWTTNYDKLIEKAFENQGKILDVKSENDDLPSRNVDASATLFKMHGSVDHPDKTVIATDDYELYLHKRLGFAKSLDGDFINRTFLFTGLSLRDPNLSHLFSMARATFYENTPEHFAVLRTPQKSDYKTKDEFDYQLNRFKLWVDDLYKRYNINVIQVDEFESLNEIMAELERRISTRNVFVSGSYPDIADSSRLYVEKISRAVGAAIAEVKLNLVSGFGLVVGSATISGFVDHSYRNATPNLARRLILRPFPQGPFENVDRATVWLKYREDMIRQAGLAIFIAGIRPDGSIAEGVLQEFRIAKQLGLRMIAIPISNSASERIFAELQPQIPKLQEILANQNAEVKTIIEVIRSLIESELRAPHV